MNIEIKQSAQGYTFSKSEGGRTLFKLQASKAIEYKQSGKVILHDVAITLYGRDSTRFDQIYGSDFEYDQKTGDVIARGEVQIDLEANPAGLGHADPGSSQGTEKSHPPENQRSNLQPEDRRRATPEKIEFSIPQATGTAVGASYQSKEDVLVLHSQVQIEFTGEGHAKVNADRATMTKTPQAIVLDHLHVKQPSQTLEADVATLFLRKDSTIERVLARGNVKADSQGGSESYLRAEQLEVLMAEQRDTVRNATFSGNVQMEASGDQPMLGNAGRVILNFAGKNQPTNVHAENEREAAATSAACHRKSRSAGFGNHRAGHGFLFLQNTSHGARRNIRPSADRPSSFGCEFAVATNPGYRDEVCGQF